MSTQRTVISGGQIITMDPVAGDITNGSLLIEDDKITQVARSAEAFAGTDAEHIDATDCVVLPG